MISSIYGTESKLGKRQSSGSMSKREASQVIIKAMRLRYDRELKGYYRNGFETVYDAIIDRPTNHKADTFEQITLLARKIVALKSKSIREKSNNDESLKIALDAYSGLCYSVGFCANCAKPTKTKIAKLTSHIEHRSIKDFADYVLPELDFVEKFIEYDNKGNFVRAYYNPAFDNQVSEKANLIYTKQNDYFIYTLQNLVDFPKENKKKYFIRKKFFSFPVIERNVYENGNLKKATFTFDNGYKRNKVTQKRTGEKSSYSLTMNEKSFARHPKNIKAISYTNFENLTIITPKQNGNEFFDASWENVLTSEQILESNFLLRFHKAKTYIGEKCSCC